MKKIVWLPVLLIMLLAMLMTACNDISELSDRSDTADTADVGSVTEEPGGEEITDAVSETPEENETDPVETELFESVDMTAAAPVTGSASLCKPYAERITASDGSVAMDHAGVTMNYTSQFHGHDSAIDRDLARYGSNFAYIKMDKGYYKGEFFLVELTGDLYDDMVLYADGVLTVYPAAVETNKTFEYNGITYDSVYGDLGSRYSFGDPITYALNIPDAVLRGSGDFDGNGYGDLLLVTGDGTVILCLVSEQGVTPTTVGTYYGDPDGLYSGDVDADGRCDLLVIDGYTVTTVLNTDAGFALQEPTVLSFTNEYTFVTVGDVNNDRRADVVWFEEEGEDTPHIRTLFGRGDGFFGPRPDEMGNTNLYAVSDRLRTKQVAWFSVGDLNGDGVGDVLVYADGGSGKGLSLGINAFDPPYDYSLFGMVCEDGTYRMYAGGRWIDKSDAVQDHINGLGVADGDHIMMYSSKDGITWDRYIDGPAFYQGGELGYDGDMGWNESWWIGNTLEPEVVYVDGVYHMLIQTTGVTPSGYYGDYINYASSTDGVHFTRKTDSPVILPEPGKDFTRFAEVYGYEIGFNHHELIYMPDDPDGKCFHLYAGHFINGQWSGYVRLRSADPTVFYWNEREETSGFAQIGNQVGYISDYDGNGNRLYLRITFHDYEDEDGWRTVPTIYYSTDGLSFYGTGISLASVDVTDPVTEMNHNVYFLGFCTVNGTGEIEKNEDGSYKLMYLATTANLSGGMPIYHAEAGVGVMNFTLE